MRCRASADYIGEHQQGMRMEEALPRGGRRDVRNHPGAGHTWGSTVQDDVTDELVLTGRGLCRMFFFIW